jgi:hypothetical protein
MREQRSFNLIVNTPENGFEHAKIVYMKSEDSSINPEFFELNLIKEMPKRDISEKRREGLVNLLSSAVLTSEMENQSVLDLDSLIDLDTTNRTYIINKDKETSQLEFGIYENVQQLLSTPMYKVISLDDFIKKHNVKKKVTKDLKGSELLTANTVMLNGDLGEKIDRLTKENSEGLVLTSVNKIKREKFTSNFESFVENKIQEIKIKNSITNNDDLQKTLLAGNEPVKYSTDGNSLEVVINKDVNLKIPMNDNDLIFSDIVMENSCFEETYRLRSDNNPEGNNCYFDSKFEAEVYQIDEYNRDSMKLNINKVRGLDQTQLNIIDEKIQKDVSAILNGYIVENENLVVDINVGVYLKIEEEVSSGVQITMSIKDTRLPEEVSNLSFELPTGEHSLGLAYDRKDMSLAADGVETFLIKSNVDRAIKDIVNEVKENEVDFVRFMKNHDIVSEATNEIIKKNLNQNKKRSQKL